MIEIIRQEENEKKRRTLPKDIRQIGKTDAGDRIYIENQVYHFLHTPGQEEKSAHVLLGRFEEISGKCCVFIESAIRLTEMQFEGGLPLWTDRTWAYIFKHINKEHDEMSIVGCAVDIRGQQPGMTVKLEAIHQKNFGGPHQVMLLMDTLEQEESFYGNYNGHLYKREGFYIYYDKNLPENISMSVHETDEETEWRVKEAAPETEENGWETKDAAQEAEENGWEAKAAEEEIRRNEWEFEERGAEKQRTDRKARESEPERKQIDREPEEDEPEVKQRFREAGREPNVSEDKKREREIKLEDFGSRAARSSQSSRYRERLKTKSKKRPVASYAPTVALAALVCLMGAAALQNQRKVNEMQSSMGYNSSETVTKDRQEEQENHVVIETVGGNVLPQENAGEDGTATDNVDDPANETQNPDVSGITSDDPTAVPDDDLAVVPDDDLTASDLPENTSETPAESELPEQQAAETIATDTVKTEAQIYLEQGYYIVQKGDNLASICRKIYQTTAMMDKICELNQIEDKDAIYAGQYLVLPN